MVELGQQLTLAGPARLTVDRHKAADGALSLNRLLLADNGHRRACNHRHRVGQEVPQLVLATIFTSHCHELKRYSTPFARLFSLAWTLNRVPTG